MTNTAAPALRFSQPVCLVPRVAERLASLVRTVPALHVANVVDDGRHVFCDIVIEGTETEIHEIADMLDRVLR